MQRRFLVVMAVALLSVGAVSCSSGSSSGSGGGGKITTTSKPKNVNVQTPAGQASLSLDGKLPPGWPSAFPVPQGAKAAGSGSLVNASKDVMVAVYTTSESAAGAFSFYTGRSSLNPTDETKVGVGSAFLGSVKISGEFTGSVTIAGAEGDSYIVIVLNPATTTTS
jgi:hypothetical protein